MRCADACPAEDFSALWSELLTEYWPQENLLRPAGQLCETRRPQLRLEILEPANEDFLEAEPAAAAAEADAVCAAAALGSLPGPEKPQTERSQGSAAENEDADALDLHPP